MIRRKYFKRLFIIYISFTLVYGLIISGFFVIQNTHSMDQQELDNKIASVTQYSRNIDQRVASFIKYVDTLYLDSDFKHFLTNSSDYYAITKLYDKLNRDMSVFSDIEGRITLSLVSDDLYINNQATMNKEGFLRDYNINASEEKMIYDFYEQARNREYMVIEDESSIKLLLITINAYSMNEKILVVQSINKNELAMLGEDEYIRIYTQLEGEENYEIEENRLIYVKKSTVLSSVMYEFDVPYKKSSFFSIRLLTGLILYLGIVVIGSILAIIVARSTYKPIRNIMETFEENNEEKQDEFAFLARITQDIKKANIDLKKTLQDQKVDSKTKVLRDLIHGIGREEHITFIQEEENLKNLNQKSRIIMINIEEENDYNDIYLSDAKNTIRNNIYTIIQRALILEGFFYELIELNLNQFGLILGDMDNKALEFMLTKLLNVIEIEENVDIVFVIGQEVDTLLEIENSYQSALKTLEYRSNFDKRAIIFYSELENVDLNHVYFYSIDLERELIIQTLQGHNSQIKQIFDRIYQINFVDHCIDNSEKRKLIIDMIGTLRRIYQKMRHKEDSNEELEVLKLFENNRYQEEEIYNRLKITFLNYSDIVKQRSQSKAIEYSSEMIKYIKEHYHEDISLEEVATHLNLSTGYFSTIFKKETGENFKGYLNKYRVKKSKEILIDEPTIKIKDLSLKVGYFNVNSFIRMFKKYEGLSPGEYAKDMNKSE